MRRFGTLALALAGLTVAFALHAQASQQGKAAPAAKAAAAPAESGVTKLTGEIVDSGCFLGHNARGAKHKGCAVKCAKSGMPLSLVTEDGTLYLLVPNHDDMAPFQQTAGLIAAVVEVNGKVMEKGGMKAVEITAIKKIEDAK